jgi:hypothetical protein
MSVSRLQNPNFTTLPLPLWKRADLQLRCQEINDRAGNRTENYCEILRLFNETIPSTIKELGIIYKNLDFIISQMPNDIRLKNRILNANSQTKSILLNYYRNYFSPIITKLQYNIKQTYNVKKLDDLIQEVNTIDTRLPQALSKEFSPTITKCNQIYVRKRSIASFAADHQIPLSSSAHSSLMTGGEKRKSIYPILSIDGGGIRGIIPATMLVEIEKITSEPIANLFQLIGGTSTGGILALGLTKPDDLFPACPQYTAQQMLNCYTQEHAQIFQKNPYHLPAPSHLSTLAKVNWVLNNPRYLSPLPFLTSKVGNTPMAEALTDVLITANGYSEIATQLATTSISGLSFGFAFLSGMMGNPNPSFMSPNSMPKTVHFFSKRGLSAVRYGQEELTPLYRANSTRLSFLDEAFTITREYTQDIRMDFAAQSTAAAPTFFPAAWLGKECLVDGGVLQNNPAIPCILDSLHRGHQSKDLFLVSLGTGDVRNPPFHHSDLGSSIVSNWFHLTQSDWKTQDTIGEILSVGANHRFQYHFDTHAPDLDDNQPATIALLEDAGKELVEKSEDALRDICKILKPESV